MKTGGGEMFVGQLLAFCPWIMIMMMKYKTRIHWICKLHIAVNRIMVILLQ